MNKKSICILSDSHGSKDRLQKCLEWCRQSGVKYVVHAGDMVVDGMAQILAKFNDLQIYIARGNADIDIEEIEEISKLENVKMQEVVITEIYKKKIAVSHIRGIAQRYAKDNNLDIDIYIHGHTHRLEVDVKSIPALINPSSLYDSGVFLVLNLESMEIKSLIIK